MNHKAPNWLQVAAQSDLTPKDLQDDSSDVAFDELRGRTELAARKFLTALQQLKRDIDDLRDNN
ncbi:MAG TPA: hypothetical protein VK629_16435 [Steroidobacteraceae bacterium]|nr:hypothetical protein [Steroidobacteraceae bacterium]